MRLRLGRTILVAPGYGVLFVRGNADHTSPSLNRSQRNGSKSADIRDSPAHRIYVAFRDIASRQNRRTAQHSTLSIRRRSYISLARKHGESTTSARSDGVKIRLDRTPPGHSLGDRPGFFAQNRPTVLRLLKVTSTAT